MLTLILQAARRRTTTNRSWTAAFRHLGAFGLFLLAILDSSPIPTFGGPDILIAILAASHRNPWYEYAGVATAGSLIGAYFTFHLAQRAGVTWLQSHFKRGRVPALMNLFDRWGTAALAVSTAVPLPFPTSMLFAAAGVSGYNTRKYMTVVGLCRAARYSLIGILADRYGRQFVRALRHPDQYWGWLLLFVVIILGAVAMSIFVGKRLENTGDVVRVS
jgi:membrane protein YqaA with SNARE-associated domain